MKVDCKYIVIHQTFAETCIIESTTQKGGGEIFIYKSSLSKSLDSGVCFIHKPTLSLEGQSFEHQ